MANTFTAAFAQTPKTATAIVSAAATNTTTDAPTNTVQLMQAGVNGAILTRLTAIPRVTTTPSALMLFLANSADSYATQRLIDSESLPSQTIGTGSGINEVNFANYSESRPLRLAAGDRLYVGTLVTNNLVFKAEYTDF